MQASRRTLAPTTLSGLSLGLRSRSGLRPAQRAALRIASTRCEAARSFQTSSARLADAVPVSAPVRKPVGAFRGGLFGFLSGTALAGAAVYYYILEEYRVSNQLLTEDIYALQAAVQRTEAYVRSLEEKIQEAQKN